MVTKTFRKQRPPASGSPDVIDVGRGYVAKWKSLRGPGSHMWYICCGGGGEESISYHQEDPNNIKQALKYAQESGLTGREGRQEFFKKFYELRDEAPPPRTKQTVLTGPTSVPGTAGHQGLLFSLD